MCVPAGRVNGWDESTTPPPLVVCWLHSTGLVEQNRQQDPPLTTAHRLTSKEHFIFGTCPIPAPHLHCTPCQTSFPSGGLHGFFRSTSLGFPSEKWGESRRFSYVASRDVLKEKKEKKKAVVAVARQDKLKWQEDGHEKRVSADRWSQLRSELGAAK